MAKKYMPLLVTFVVLLAFAQGCAAPRKYAWGDYDSAMYVHYKTPQDREAHLERLNEIVINAEIENQIPPGLYAEYGYALFESGNTKEAITYFEKEKAKWPESNVLMEKMIRNAKRQQENLEKSSPQGPLEGQEVTK